MHLNEGPALARALEKLPRSLRALKLTSLGGMRTAVPLGMQLQGLTQVTALTLASRWGCALQHARLQTPCSLVPLLKIIASPTRLVGLASRIRILTSTRRWSTVERNHELGWRSLRCICACVGLHLSAGL